MPDVITLGETMAVMATTQAGRLRNSPHLRLGIGGAESNVAISLARLGISVAWASSLGTDELGDFVLSKVRGEGVDCTAVTRVNAPTGLYLRDNFSAGVRAFYYRKGSAASIMKVDHIDAQFLSNTKVLHTTGITMALSPTCEALAIEAAKAAKDQGIVVSFDVNFRSKLWGAQRARKSMEQILPYVDILFIGDDEAKLLWDDGDTSVAHHLASFGPKEVVLKQGALGATQLKDGRLVSALGFKVDVVDTVGAGDAFAAGYLAATLWDLSSLDKLRYANAMGAYCVMNMGDCENAPTRKELESFLNQEANIGR